MDRRDYDWTEHFVYAFSPNWDSWKCMCRYCGITIDIKKEVMSNHLMECPVFNSVRIRIVHYCIGKDGKQDHGVYKDNNTVFRKCDDVQ